MLVPAKVCLKPDREMFMVLPEVKTTVRSSISLGRLPLKVPDIPAALRVVGLGVVVVVGTVAGGTVVVGLCLRTPATTGVLATVELAATVVDSTGAVVDSAGAAVVSTGAAVVPTSAEHSTGICSEQVGSLGWKQVALLVASV